MSPSRRALFVLVAWLGLGAVVSFLPALEAVWTWAGLVLLGVAVLDLGAGLLGRAPRVERRVPAAVSMGSVAKARLIFANPGRRRLRLRAFDHHPVRMHAEGLPLRLVLPRGEGAELAYELRPECRGRHEFGPIELRVATPLGLFERHVHVRARESLRVYSDYQAVAGYELLAAEDRTGALGIRRRPRRGEGIDFLQLREYRAGDPLRQIDWKATARLRRPISREYQDERDQQILFLVDCGRRLRARDGSESHLDAALDALLFLSHVALRQGDAVGLMTFSGERRWLAPRKGVSQARVILNSTYDLEASARTADYRAAARDLVTRVRKRALVVILSNVRDEDASELGAAIQLLSRRHVVLLASLQETAVREALTSPVEDLDDALRVASVHLYLEQRQRAIRPLRRAGAIVLDCEPAELSVALVNGYLDVKASGRL